MKLRTKHKITAVFIFLLSFTNLISVAQTREVNAALEDFSEVKTFNGVEVQVIPSEENRIVITGHSREDVKFKIVEHRLEIRLSLDNIWSKDNTRITIYGSNITTIDANQGSLVEISDHLKGEELTFRVQEGANIRARVNGRRIVSKAVTGGRITLEGKADEQEVDLNTGGLYYGSELRTKETTVRAGTAAKGEVYATEYVRATAKLGGTIELFGRPKEVDQKTSLGGRIL